jgi:hypothetical protein
MNITTTSLKLYQVYERNAKIDLPPIVTERIQSMLTDPDEFSSSAAARCWLYRRMTYSRATFTTDTSFKRSESHCILVPGTQFWQYVHEADLQFVVSEYPAQHDFWFLTPARLVGSALHDAQKAQGSPEVLIVEQFVFTS